MLIICCEYCFKFVLVVDDDDDDDGDVEGNLVMAASHITPTAITFMVKHGSGIISVGMKEEDLERLKLPLMSPENEDDSSAPSFTVTVVYIYICGSYFILDVGEIAYIEFFVTIIGC